MKLISVDEARSRAGFGSLTSSEIVDSVASAVYKDSGNKQTASSLEFPRFQLQKWSIKEARDVIEGLGYKVTVNPDKKSIKLQISWYFDSNKETKLIFEDPYAQ